MAEAITFYEGFKILVLLGILWKQTEFSMKEQDCTTEVLESSVASSCGFD